MSASSAGQTTPGVEDDGRRNEDERRAFLVDHVREIDMRLGRLKRGFTAQALLEHFMVAGYLCLLNEDVMLTIQGLAPELFRAADPLAVEYRTAAYGVVVLHRFNALSPLRPARCDYGPWEGQVRAARELICTLEADRLEKLAAMLPAQAHLHRLRCADLGRMHRFHARLKGLSGRGADELSAAVERSDHTRIAELAIAGTSDHGLAEAHGVVAELRRSESRQPPERA